MADYFSDAPLGGDEAAITAAIVHAAAVAAHREGEPTDDGGSHVRRLLRRARGALTGLALGDALGMPTQAMSVGEIDRYYGGPITRLMASVPEQPIAPNMPAGSVTDDTEQAFLLAYRLLNDNATLISTQTDVHAVGQMTGAATESAAEPVTAESDAVDAPTSPASPSVTFDNIQYARDLLAWEQRMQQRGSLDLLGPSTQRALAALMHGASINETGRFGTTNGGAMRVAPIGIAFSTKAPNDLLAHMAYESCKITHNTRPGVEATLLVAAAVSLAMGGYDDPIRGALEYVAELPIVGYWCPRASVLARTRYFVDWARGAQGAALDDNQFAAALRIDCGTSLEANESIPAAFAIASRFATNPTQALCFAASLGGDTDTIGAIAGAILGAQYGPDGFCEAGREAVTNRLKEVNGLDIDRTAIGLVRLRLATMQ